MAKTKIFLSYSHRDKELAHKFHDYLTENDYEILWDENIVTVGSDFNKKLSKALLEADIYLPIISNNFLNSHFARNELSFAIGYNKGNEMPVIFPYIAYGEDISIPTDLVSILCIMGTSNINADLNKISIELSKVNGSIFAEKENKNKIIEQISTSLEIYLKDVFEKLEKNEKRNRILAYLCYTASALLLLLVVFLITTVNNFIPDDIDMVRIITFAIKNISILSVLAALSRLTFILGKSFMVESIRNGDRIHAISFGKFFIQAYGNKITRQEIREILGEWNIDKGSSFHTQDAKEIDPNFYGTLELLKSYFKK